jgi:hypothetical protein
VIANFSQTALDSGMLALFLSEMAFLKTSQDGYVMLRAEAQEILDRSESLATVHLPASAAEMREREDDVVASVMEPLSRLRSRVGGDVLPLTIFILTHCVCRGVLFSAFGAKEEWAPYRKLLLISLGELGIDGESEAKALEQRSRGIVEGSGDTATLENSARRELVNDTLKHLWELIHERWSEPVAVRDELASIKSTIETFRQQSHEEHKQILESVSQLRTQLVAQLEARGVPKAQAKELADTSSPSFAKRLARWTRKEKVRDGAEAALWAALDFVPVGGALKLGVKLATAIRKATKGK